MIPNYVLDDFTPLTAVVTEFQSSPFIVRDGSDLPEKGEAGNVYVFEIEPMVVDIPAEYLENDTASIVTRFPVRYKSITLAEDGFNGDHIFLEIKPVK